MNSEESKKILELMQEQARNKPMLQAGVIDTNKILIGLLGAILFLMWNQQDELIDSSNQAKNDISHIMDDVQDLKDASKDVESLRGAVSGYQQQLQHFGTGMQRIEGVINRVETQMNEYMKVPRFSQANYDANIKPVHTSIQSNTDQINGLRNEFKLLQDEVRELSTQFRLMNKTTP